MQETSPRMASGRWSHKICTIKDTEVLSDRCTCFKPAHGHSITSDPQKPLQHKRSSHDVQIIRARKQKHMRSSTSPADKRHTRPCRRNPERPMVPNQRSQHLPATSACPHTNEMDRNRFWFVVLVVLKLYIFVLHVLGWIVKYFVFICIVWDEFDNFTSWSTHNVMSITDIGA
jgi:hypothetical protein